MDQITNPANLERERLDEPVARPRRWRWKATALGVAVALGLFLAWLGLADAKGSVGNRSRINLTVNVQGTWIPR